MRQTNPLPSLAKLQEILTYEPDTGLFRWSKSRRGRTWKGHVAGSNCGAYIAIRTPLGRFYAHRLAWRFIYGDNAENIPGPDHKDRNGKNNAAVNLRPATEQQQFFNRSSGIVPESGYRGVTWCKKNEKWRARCKIAKKEYWLGIYEDPAEAGAAYQKFIREHHTEFALPDDIR